MPVSHHSHSGEYCGHAQDKLEDIVKECLQQRIQVLALTEHMPRDQTADLYPEEIEAGTTPKILETIFKNYHAEARRLQVKYAGEIQLLVGLEIDWIRPASRKHIEYLLGQHQFDTLVGSVHHVHGVPIDYSAELYLRALAVSRANSEVASIPAAPEEMLFADYYDAQLAMLEALRPPIVGHFDLIRLLSENPNDDPKTYSRVWRKILRNLLFVKEYGGVLEVNSAAVRKGLHEPYPQRAIVSRFNEMGGKFALSDDSHGIRQIGWGYRKVLHWLRSCGVERMVIFARGHSTKDPRFPGINTTEQSILNLLLYEYFETPTNLNREEHWPKSEGSEDSNETVLSPMYPAPVNQISGQGPPTTTILPLDTGSPLASDHDPMP